jgi:putative glutamine amidotransferase
MSKQPVVGVALRPEAREGTPRRLLLNRAYIDALQQADLAVLLLPTGADERGLRSLYDLCDAVMLPGGPDVQPELYGESVQAGCEVSSSAELDATELRTTTWALEDGRPLLAICRGMQVLNVAVGGTLWQDLTAQRSGSLLHRHRGERNELVHQISIENGTRLRDIAAAACIDVNSLHHQGIRKVGRGLEVTARAPDGLVEGVELTSHRYAVGVQCHPEELIAGSAWARRLFGDFAAAARE